MENKDGYVSVGAGVLTWMRPERVCDRYGFVYLIKGGKTSQTASPGSVLRKDQLTALVGCRGQLIAHVLEPRQSTHIGDLFHGVEPQTPERHEDIVLGAGTVAIEAPPEIAPGVQIGLLPDDGRERLWLDLQALYRAHEQLVDLRFHAERLL